MKKLKTYLRDLKQSLQGFPQAEQSEILAEIESHIEDGLDDGAMGATIEDKEAKLLRELGAPREMRNGLQALYQQRDWQGMILALIPLLFVSFSMNLNHFSGYISSLCICLALLFVAYSGRSSSLFGWWAAWTIVTGLTVISNLDGHLNFWLLLLVRLVAIPVMVWAYGRLLWHNRHNKVITAIALTPVTWAILFKMIEAIPLTRTIHFFLSVKLYLPLLFVTITICLFMLPNWRMQWLSLSSNTLIGIVIISLLTFNNSPPSLNLIPKLPILLVPILGGLVLNRWHLSSHNLRQAQI